MSNFANDKCGFEYFSPLIQERDYIATSCNPETLGCLGAQNITAGKGDPVYTTFDDIEQVERCLRENSQTGWFKGDGLNDGVSDEPPSSAMKHKLHFMILTITLFNLIAGTFAYTISSHFSISNTFNPTT